VAGACRRAVLQLGQQILSPAQLQNVSRAAQELNLSQPALSRAIRRLERRYGVELFDRSKQRMRLNRFGSVVCDRIEAALRELSLVEDDIALLQEPQPGVVSLAFLHSFGTWLVPDLLGRFATVEPATQFVLHQDSADEVRARLADGRADLVITSPRPPTRSSVGRLCRTRGSRWRCPRPTVWPVAHRSPWPRSSTRASSPCSRSSGSGRRRTRCSRGAAHNPASSWRVPRSPPSRRWSALVSASRSRRGGAHAPTASGVVSIPLIDDDAYRTIGLAWRLDRPLPAPVRRFRSFVISTGPSV
jgi:LysR family transcriptional regulator, transcription activator of glutamate synthase operon